MKLKLKNTPEQVELIAGISKSLDSFFETFGAEGLRQQFGLMTRGYIARN